MVTQLAAKMLLILTNHVPAQKILIAQKWTLMEEKRNIKCCAPASPWILATMLMVTVLALLDQSANQMRNAVTLHHTLELWEIIQLQKTPSAAP